MLLCVHLTGDIYAESAKDSSFVELWRFVPNCDLWKINPFPINQPPLTLLTLRLKRGFCVLTPPFFWMLYGDRYAMIIGFCVLTPPFFWMLYGDRYAMIFLRRMRTYGWVVLGSAHWIIWRFFLWDEMCSRFSRLISSPLIKGNPELPEWVQNECSGGKAWCSFGIIIVYGMVFCIRIFSNLKPQRGSRLPYWLHRSFECCMAIDAQGLLAKKSSRCISPDRVFVIRWIVKIMC